MKMYYGLLLNSSMLALEKYNNDDEDELVSESMPSLSSMPSINTSGGKKRKSKQFSNE